MKKIMIALAAGIVFAGLAATAEGAPARLRSCKNPTQIRQQKKLKLCVTKNPACTKQQLKKRDGSCRTR